MSKKEAATYGEKAGTGHKKTSDPRKRSMMEQY